ncbi:nnp-1 protein putative nuclear protein 1 nop52 [Anaeramoeba ignava]|uniref:Nnp-1 protein putative nuclear protein 1 nop52 n=1 Tax=Anaeramoeba ignava TaxID=1746090 RepID=A0A9Q0LQF8_ANAIG|nr:nnp-1 protein putative nuclear protein 1 nop52 [Anaeramoeba ignava]
MDWNKAIQNLLLNIQQSQISANSLPSKTILDSIISIYKHIIISQKLFPQQTPQKIKIGIKTLLKNADYLDSNNKLILSEYLNRIIHNSIHFYKEIIISTLFKSFIKLTSRAKLISLEKLCEISHLIDLNNSKNNLSLLIIGLADFVKNQSVESHFEIFSRNQFVKLFEIFGNHFEKEILDKLSLAFIQNLSHDSTIIQRNCANGLVVIAHSCSLRNCLDFIWDSIFANFNKKLAKSESKQKTLLKLIDREALLNAKYIQGILTFNFYLFTNTSKQSSSIKFNPLIIEIAKRLVTNYSRTLTSLVTISLENIQILISNYPHQDEKPSKENFTEMEQELLPVFEKIIEDTKVFISVKNLVLRCFLQILKKHPDAFIQKYGDGPEKFHFIKQAFQINDPLTQSQCIKLISQLTKTSFRKDFAKFNDEIHNFIETILVSTKNQQFQQVQKTSIESLAKITHLIGNNSLFQNFTVRCIEPIINIGNETNTHNLKISILNLFLKIKIQDNFLEIYRNNPQELSKWSKVFIQNRLSLEEKINDFIFSCLFDQNENLSKQAAKVLSAAFYSCQDQQRLDIQERISKSFFQANQNQIKLRGLLFVVDFIVSQALKEKKLNINNNNNNNNNNKNNDFLQFIQSTLLDFLFSPLVENSVFHHLLILKILNKNFQILGNLSFSNQQKEEVVIHLLNILEICKDIQEFKIPKEIYNSPQQFHFIEQTIKLFGMKKQKNIFKIKKHQQGLTPKKQNPQTPQKQTPQKQTPHQQTPYKQTPHQQTPYKQIPYKQIQVQVENNNSAKSRSINIKNINHALFTSHFIEQNNYIESFPELKILLSYSNKHINREYCTLQYYFNLFQVIHQAKEFGEATLDLKQNSFFQIRKYCLNLLSSILQKMELHLKVSYTRRIIELLNYFANYDQGSVSFCLSSLISSYPLQIDSKKQKTEQLETNTPSSKISNLKLFTFNLSSPLINYLSDHFISTCHFAVSPQILLLFSNILQIKDHQIISEKITNFIQSPIFVNLMKQSPNIHHKIKILGALIHFFIKLFLSKRYKKLHLSTKQIHNLIKSFIHDCLETSTQSYKTQIFSQVSQSFFEVLEANYQNTSISKITHRFLKRSIEKNHEIYLIQLFGNLLTKFHNDSDLSSLISSEMLKIFSIVVKDGANPIIKSTKKLHRNIFNNQILLGNFTIFTQISRFMETLLLLQFIRKEIFIDQSLANLDNIPTVVLFLSPILRFFNLNELNLLFQKTNQQLNSAQFLEKILFTIIDESNFKTITNNEILYFSYLVFLIRDFMQKNGISFEFKAKIKLKIQEMLSNVTQGKSYSKQNTLFLYELIEISKILAKKDEIMWWCELWKESKLKIQYIQDLAFNNISKNSFYLLEKGSNEEKKIAIDSIYSVLNSPEFLEQVFLNLDLSFVSGSIKCLINQDYHFADIVISFCKQKLTDQLPYSFARRLLNLVVMIPNVNQEKELILKQMIPKLKIKSLRERSKQQIQNINLEKSITPNSEQKQQTERIRRFVKINLELDEFDTSNHPLQISIIFNNESYLGQYQNFLEKQLIRSKMFYIYAERYTEPEFRQFSKIDKKHILSSIPLILSLSPKSKFLEIITEIVSDYIFYSLSNPKHFFAKLDYAKWNKEVSFVIQTITLLLKNEYLQENLFANKDTLLHNQFLIGFCINLCVYFTNECPFASQNFPGYLNLLMKLFSVVFDRMEKNEFEKKFIVIFSNLVHGLFNREDETTNNKKKPHSYIVFTKNTKEAKKKVLELNTDYVHKHEDDYKQGLAFLFELSLNNEKFTMPNYEKSNTTQNKEQIQSFELELIKKFIRKLMRRNLSNILLNEKIFSSVLIIYFHGVFMKDAKNSIQLFDLDEPKEMIEKILMIINSIGVNSSQDFLMLWNLLWDCLTSQEKETQKELIEEFELIQCRLIQGLTSLLLLMVREEMGNPNSKWKFYPREQTKEILSTKSGQFLSFLHLIIDQSIFEMVNPEEESYGHYIKCFDPKSEKYYSVYNPFNRFEISFFNQKSHEIMIQKSPFKSNIEREFGREKELLEANQYSLWELIKQSKINIIYEGIRIRKYVQQFISYLKSLHSILVLSDLFGKRQFKETIAIFENIVKNTNNSPDDIMRRMAIIGLCKAASFQQEETENNLNRSMLIQKTLKKCFKSSHKATILSALKGLLYIIEVKLNSVMFGIITFLFKNLKQQIESESNISIRNLLFSVSFLLIQRYTKQSVDSHFAQEFLDLCFVFLKSKSLGYHDIDCIIRGIEQLLITGPISVDHCQMISTVFQSKLKRMESKKFIRFFQLMLTNILIGIDKNVSISRIIYDLLKITQSNQSIEGEMIARIIPMLTNKIISLDYLFQTTLQVISDPKSFYLVPLLKIVFSLSCNMLDNFPQKLDQMSKDLMSILDGVLSKKPKSYSFWCLCSLLVCFSQDFKIRNLFFKLIELNHYNTFNDKEYSVISHIFSIVSIDFISRLDLIDSKTFLSKTHQFKRVSKQN